MKQKTTTKVHRFLHLLPAVLMAPAIAAAGLQVEENKGFMLLSTSSTKTLQKELAESASQGFHIVATASKGGGQVVLMKKTAASEQNYEYQVLGTTKVDTMHKELNETAAEGYCVLRGTMLSRKRVFGVPEIVLFMERVPGSSRRCEYRVIGTGRTSTMEKEILEAVEEGFAVLGIAEASELTAVLERELK